MFFQTSTCLSITPFTLSVQMNLLNEDKTSLSHSHNIIGLIIARFFEHKKKHIAEFTMYFLIQYV